jgi:hypothetical protein
MFGTNSDSPYDASPTERPRKDSDGFDNFWIFSDGPKKKSDVESMHAESDRVLQFGTIAPGVQIYSGGAIPIDLIGEDKKPYGPKIGTCLET